MNKLYSGLVRALGEVAKERLENKGAMFDKESFLELMISEGIIGFPKVPIKLSYLSVESHVYVNWRKVLRNVGLTMKVTGYVTDFILDEFTKKRRINVDCVVGVPEGALALATLVQLELARRSPEGPNAYSFGVLRKVPKSHGAPENRYFIAFPRGNVVLLEDVITSGSSALEVLRKLQRSNANMVGVVCLTDRQESKGYSAEQKFRDAGVPLFSLVKMEEILPLAYERLRPGEIIGWKIQEEYEKYGNVSIRLVDKFYKS